MMPIKVDLNELRNNNIFKKRLSLQHDSALQLHNSVEETKSNTSEEGTDDNSTDEEDESQREQVGQQEEKIQGAVEIGGGLRNSRVLRSESENLSVVGSPTPGFSRSFSTNVVLRTSGGLQPRPISTHAMPDVIDIDTTSMPGLGANVSASPTSRILDLAVPARPTTPITVPTAEQEPSEKVTATKKKRSKGILSAVSGISPGKLKGKLERITSGKFKPVSGDTKREVRSSSELSFLSPRGDSPSPDSSPIFTSISLPETRQIHRLSGTSSPQHSPQLSVRFLTQTPPPDAPYPSSTNPLSKSTDDIPNSGLMNDILHCNIGCIYSL